jgi:hypothetical protein
VLHLQPGEGWVALSRDLRRGLAVAGAAVGLGGAAAAGVLLELSRRGADAGPFARGPYLTRVSQTGAHLRWLAHGDAAVRVDAVAPDGRRAAAGSDGVLAGLRPDTVYRWTASVRERVRASGSFTTAPRRLDGPLSFVVFGDYGADSDPERAVAKVAVAQRPRLLVTTGDNSYLAATANLLDRNLFTPLRELLALAPNYGVVGDHDLVFDAGRRALVEALDWPGGGDRFDLRYGPLQFVGLGLRGDRGDLPFAARALARPGPAARFVLVHQPLKAGNPLLPVLARGATAVLSGHLHAYERRQRPEAPGVPMLTVGTGGAPRNPRATPRSPDARVHLAEFGLLRVDVAPGRVSYRFLDPEGRERDRLIRPLRP